jgi:hypothetical protein
MWQTSRRYFNSSHSLSKTVTSTRAMVLTILSRSSWRFTGTDGMYTLSSTNPQNENPQVSDWVIWVAVERSCHDQSIFLGTSTTWCGFCVPQMIRLWRFTFSDKWNVASSLQIILSKNKISCLRRFSISVQTFLRCGRSLGFNTFSSWNLYNLIRSTLHSVVWEISPSSLLDRRAESNILGKMDRSWRLHSMATQITQSDTHGLFILGIRER